MASQLLLCVWIHFTMIIYTSCQSFKTVHTPSGPIKGVVVPTLGKDIVQFRNIPYAKPPIGNLRFEKPLPIEPWTEILDGTVFGPSCMQNRSVLSDMGENTDHAMSEDCLYLNVYVPGDVSTNANKAVMVWIHGGGFVLGYGWGYDASFLTMKDIIVVTINYRLGIFGFLSTGDLTMPSNFGLWDMIEALKWVNKNIASFGGDPDSVTIFGESAGGFAVSFLGIIPSTSGLFKRMIAQSGSAIAFLGISRNHAKVAKSIGNLVGCVADKDSDIDNHVLRDCLKRKTADELLQAQSNPGTQHFGNFSLLPAIWPVIDGELLQRSPLDSLNDPNSEESNYFRSLDLLAGTTDNEGSLMPMFLAGFQESMEFNMTEGIPTPVLCDVVAPTLAKEMFNDNSVASDLICKEYSSDNLEQQSRNIVNLFADSWFVFPTMHLLEFHAKDKLSPNTYQYIYTQAVNFWFLIPTYPWMEGAGHAVELLYMFGPTGLSERDPSLSTDEGKAFTDVLVTYWTNFAKSGNPNGDGLVPWKAFSLSSRDYLELKYQPSPGENLFEKRMKFLSQDISNKIQTAAKTEL
ncbi:cocaine esterase-like [Ylistrum balloti]|uniref:cocaine esterase-like n=1 Tax=Ylistrum balloti TaxID=509963 RepID=UPI002905C10F|nr:cocaine esterase-like [Ylistrum balloti]